MTAAEGAAKPCGDWAYFRAVADWLPEPFFPTQAFLVFTGVVLAVYWCIPRRWNNARVVLLVIASLHFYAAWNAGLALLVSATSLADYMFARLLDAAKSPPLRKALLCTSIAMNLGVLGYFKYRGFFLNELHELFTHCGVEPGYDKLDLARLLIPFGISFYTFEAISYAADVYSRRAKAEPSLPHFLLFILFFPHLVAGPIVRGGDFLRQAHRIKRWNWLRARVGLQLFLLGLFKKFAIADRMAIFSDPVFADPPAFSSHANWLAVLAYSLRIYADFSGYSDMALGVAHFFGYRLSQNFNMPYLAVNPSDFWRRWHISLSSWLRDYAFIPLGGSRGGAGATARNLMIVMALGGLWHGANWSYLLWGLYHGLLLVLHRGFQCCCQALPILAAILESLPGTILRIFATFAAISLGWVLFQPDLHQALAMSAKLFTGPFDGMGFKLHARSLIWTVAILFACQSIARSSVWRKIWDRLPPATVGAALASLLCLAQFFAPCREAMFIYFTF